MASESFRVSFGGGPSGYAMGHSTGGVTLTLEIGAGGDKLDVTIRTTPYGARAIANALYEAADYAERTQETGPGEEMVS